MGMETRQGGSHLDIGRCGIIPISQHGPPEIPDQAVEGHQYPEAGDPMVLGIHDLDDHEATEEPAAQGPDLDAL
jgi:hypothetical protein